MQHIKVRREKMLCLVKRKNEQSEDCPNMEGKELTAGMRSV